MGLDYIELIVEIEKKFEISINESEIYHADTVGKLAEVVYKRLKKDAYDPCTTQKGFYILRQHLIFEYKLSRSEVKPDTKLNDIVPKRRRLKMWRSLIKAITNDPNNIELELSLWPKFIFLYFCPLLVLALILYLLPWEASWQAILAAFTTSWIFSWLLTPLRNKIPDNCSTVKDLIPYITTRGIKVWEKDEVYEEIKNLIAEMFYINPVLITPDSHIIDDLGLA